MPSGDTHELNTLANLSCMWTAPGTKSASDMPYDSQEKPWHVVLTVPSTHRSEVSHPSCAQRETFSLFTQSRDTVDYMPQEHRLLGEQTMHVRNSEMGQLRVQFLEVAL